MAIVSEIIQSRGIVRIIAEGSVAVRVRKSHFAKCPVEIGQDIDIPSYMDRLAAVQFADGWESALNSLDVCARTEKDIAAALRRRGYVEPVIQAVTQRLKENGLIDDARFAERMAEQQLGKPVGVYALRRKLRSKGIAEADVEQALEAFDDDQQQAAALAAAQKLFRKYEALPPREGKAKLSQALARRGFGWDAIAAATEQLFED